MGSRTDDARAAFAETVLLGLDDTVAADAPDADEPAPPVRTIAKGSPDRYRVESELGAGGMGRVLDATDLWFGRRVALKEILVDAAPPSLVRRFLLEALVTGNLEHPGIVAVHERGVRDGRPYYVMRKLAGRTLAQALEESRSFEERSSFVPTIVRVAQTIAFAHERGVIHRDLKPENIVLGTHGEVTVIDWGIARIRKLDHLGVDAGTAALLGDGHKTVAGSVLGTPMYMAPEQAAGRLDAVDERTDVFALGALLYHVLAGHPPYEGPTVQAQMAKAIAGKMPPFDARKEKVPAPLVAICERAMAKDPAARFRSATEMAEALERALREALVGGGSRMIEALTGGITFVSLGVGSLLFAVMMWRALPAWRLMGTGVIFTTTAGVFGIPLALIELFTKGRHRLGSLVLAFAGLTFLGGVLATLLGGLQIITTVRQPEIMQDALRFRETLMEGAYEVSGNPIVGSAFAGLLLLLWAVAHRRAQRADAART